MPPFCEKHTKFWQRMSDGTMGCVECELDRALRKSLTGDNCPCCNGTGRLRTVEPGEMSDV